MVVGSLEERAAADPTWIGSARAFSLASKPKLAMSFVEMTHIDRFLSLKLIDTTASPRRLRPNSRASDFLSVSHNRVLPL